jgi:hypothetical protein
MEYNIVTNLRIINEVKRYKNFTVSLGYANYVGQTEQKTLNDKDRFAYYYNTKYKTTIFGQGYIGDINFYVDHYIVQDQIAIYFNKEEYPFDWDWKAVKEKGMEWYLGSLLKSIHDEINKKEEVEKNQIEGAPKGDPYKVINNPGSVTFEDIKAYQEAKRKGLI